jgi:phosphoribosyl-ATP pyrophosphohydrolase
MNYKFEELLEFAEQEAHKAIKRYPQPNYVLLKIAEEAGEVVRAGIHVAENRMDRQELQKEVVQLIAMLMRLVEEGDQTIGLKPL